MSQVRDFNFYTVDEFKKYIEKIKKTVTREINYIQVHHTWKPTLNGYNLSKDKEQVIRSMWVHHTVTNKWSDIGQHFTFVPGGAWDGRDLKIKPAGIENFNTGCICVEMLGDFDIGRESMAGQYLEDVSMMFAILQEAWPKAQFIFHNEKSTKTCPGTSIAKKPFVEKIQSQRVKLKKVAPIYTPVTAINHLKDKTVIKSPDYWLQCTKLQKNVEPKNIVSLVKQFYAIKYGKSATYEIALRQLGIDGVFTSMTFWKNVEKEKFVPISYAETVLKRMAALI